MAVTPSTSETNVAFGFLMSNYDKTMGKMSSPLVYDRKIHAAVSHRASWGSHSGAHRYLPLNSGDGPQRQNGSAMCHGGGWTEDNAGKRGRETCSWGLWVMCNLLCNDFKGRGEILSQKQNCWNWKCCTKINLTKTNKCSWTEQTDLQQRLGSPYSCSTWIPNVFLSPLHSWMWEADGAVWASGGVGCRQGRGASLSDPPRFGFHHCYAAKETQGLQWRMEDACCSGQVPFAQLWPFHVIPTLCH